MDIKEKDLINIRTMNSVKPKRGPKVDELVSAAVGKKVFITNPKLIAKLAEWKQAKNNPEEPDNFLDDESKVLELMEIL